MPQILEQQQQLETLPYDRAYEERVRKEMNRKDDPFDKTQSWKTHANLATGCYISVPTRAE